MHRTRAISNITLEVHHSGTPRLRDGMRWDELGKLCYYRHVQTDRQTGVSKPVSDTLHGSTAIASI